MGVYGTARTIFCVAVLCNFNSLVNDLIDRSVEWHAIIVGQDEPLNERILQWMLKLCLSYYNHYYLKRMEEGQH